jgi:hypothetical protein
MSKSKFSICVALTCIMMLFGCALIDFNKDTTAYKRDVGTLPKDKEMSFPSKQAMAAGAALSNITAAKVYYLGTKPLSPDAKVLYDMTYRFMGLCGVNMDFDPSDPESVAKVFENADKAISEKDKNIADLKQQVADFTTQLAAKETIIRDKGKEIEGVKTTLKAQIGTIIWVTLGCIILLVLILGGVQAYTGIPVLSMAIGFVTGATKTLFNAAKQTGSAIEQWKKDHDDQIQQLKNAGKNEAAEVLQGARDSLGALLSSHQDSAVKTFIQTKLKLNS